MIYIYIYIGIDFITKEKTFKNNEVASIKLWDTAGQERFRTITQTFYKQAQGVLIIYNVTDKESFSNVNIWLKSISEYADTNIIRYLIGNKCDLTDERVITKHQGKEMANKYGMPFFETSAKHNINVLQSIDQLIEEIYITNDLGKKEDKKVLKEVGGQRVTSAQSILKSNKKKNKKSWC